MSFTPHTREEIREMLDAIGVGGVSDLFRPPYTIARAVEDRAVVPLASWRMPSASDTAPACDWLAPSAS